MTAIVYVKMTFPKRKMYKPWITNGVKNVYRKKKLICTGCLFILNNSWYLTDTDNFD